LIFHLSHLSNNPLYPHDDLLNPEKPETWSLAKNNDMALLAYTIAQLQLEGATPPWSGFHGHKVEWCSLDDRRKTAAASLKEASLDDNDRKMLLRVISKLEQDAACEIACNTNDVNGEKRCSQY